MSFSSNTSDKDLENRFLARILQWGFNNPKLIVALLIAVLLGGIVSWETLPIEAYPDLGPQNVQIITQQTGTAAQEMEQQVTIPLERGLASTPGLAHSRSVSTFGLSLITLTFADDTDIYQDRNLVLAQLSTIDLPDGAKPQLGPLTGPSSEILRYVLQSDNKNLMQLSDIQKWIVIPALQWVPGIVNVDNFGGFTKEYQLRLDPEKLYKYNLDFQTVLSAMRSSNANAGGGRVTRGEQSYVVRGVGRIRNLEDMGNTVVMSLNGTPVLLKDLGTLEFGHQVRQGILGWNGNPDAVEGVVTMLRGLSADKVLTDLHKSIDELQERLKPLGVKMVLFLDRANLIHATTEKVGETIGTGVLLVFVLLTCLLGNAVCALIVSLSIPFSLGVTFLLMRVCNIHASLFSLGAIDFGIIVDGSIVICEIILSLREQKADSALSKSETLTVLTKQGKAILTATLIVMVAYAPLFAFNGNEGKMFRPLACTVLFSLFGALLCALCVIPYFTWAYFRKPRKCRQNKTLLKIEHRYARLLNWFIARPRITFGCAGLALVGVIFLGSRAGQDFMPSLDEGALWLQVELPAGISMEEAQKSADKIRKAVNSFSEVSYAATQLGRSDEATDPWTPSHIEMPVGLTPYDQWPSWESKERFIHRLRRKLDKIPGISFTISQPIEDNLQDQLGGAHAPLILRVYGQDFAELRRLSQEAVRALRTIPQSEEVSVLQEPPIPNIVVETDRAKAARYGIPIQDVADIFTYGMGNQALTTVIDGERSYDATIHMPEDQVADLNYLARLPLAANNQSFNALGNNNALIPLKEIAAISLRSGESNIAHEMGQRQVTIQIDNGSLSADKYVERGQALLDKLQYDRAHYQFQWAGSIEQAKEMQVRLTVALLVMTLLMLALLCVEFRGLRIALLVLGCLPLAALGGLLAINLRGATLNIATAAGFIALFGVAIQNGVLMINAIRAHQLRGMTPRQAVLAGTQERFRPVITTAAVASAGMIPAAMATGIGTDFQRGLATVIVGGLGIATLLTLFLLPLVFCAVEEYIERRRARATQRTEIPL